MLQGLDGTLLPPGFAETALGREFAGELGEVTCGEARRAFGSWWARVRTAVGPATGLRALFDRAATAFFGLLGFDLDGSSRPFGPYLSTRLRIGGQDAAQAIVAGWDTDLASAWRDSVRHAAAADLRWAMAFNGRQVRLVDVRRAYARAFLEFDLSSTVDDEQTFSVFWGLMRGAAFQEGSGAQGGRLGRRLLDRVLDAAHRHTITVCGSLEAGVRAALVEVAQGFVGGLNRRGPFEPALASAFEQSLTVVYRILFLLFAEARRLVPLWHPIYRDGYSMEALVERVIREADTLGFWEALQAMARLAHRGCRAADLRVVGFGGRLFEPARTPLADGPTLSDVRIWRVLLALTTRAERDGRRPITYVDLGVEQLGSVYERVLDYSPRLTPGSREVRLETGSGRRKATGTFYTPRSITDYLVRRALVPLVDTATPEAILSLRVLDPAMGSGAFLVSACRHLAAAYERALVDAGACRQSDLSDHDRAAFRRLVAQRCLYGVDLNPMAVQLARLSLWLATLAADRPLTFLDHRLRTGNSIVGASLEDLARQPPGSTRRRVGLTPLPLFGHADLQPALGPILPVRGLMASEPDDSPADVRRKEQALQRLEQAGSPLARWKAVADLWCAGWFSASVVGRAPAIFQRLSADVLAGRPVRGQLADWIAEAARVAGEERFFHWTFEFPEAFFDERGQPLARAGFDAVVGNPPWEMLRADQGAESERRQRRELVSRLVRFTRDSGIYSAGHRGHPNSYQVFLERAVQLLRPGGRVGLVLPGGLLSDETSSTLRRFVMDRCRLDPIIGFENRAAIFPIHRDVRFVLLTGTMGDVTRDVSCRLGERDPALLDTLPDSSAGDIGALRITRTFLERISGSSLAVPDLRSRTDIEIVDRVFSTVLPLGHPDGWGVRFGRELNASDDRDALGPAGSGLAVLEGKRLHPFRADLAAVSHAVDRDAARQRLGGTPFDRARLGYRDVASARNRLTLIAAVLPAGCVTTHTIFCLKSPLELREQHYLCGVLNSIVANYFVRLRVGTHVTTAIVEGLPVPRLPPSSVGFRRIADLAERLARAAPAGDTHLAELHARVARLYGLTAAELDHVLGRFPLLTVSLRLSIANAFRSRAL
jgi:hypothetical protein